MDAHFPVYVQGRIHLAQHRYPPPTLNILTIVDNRRKTANQITIPRKQYSNRQYYSHGFHFYCRPNPKSQTLNSIRVAMIERNRDVTNTVNSTSLLRISATTMARIP